MKHIQGITFTHLKSNDARLYKENKNKKKNVFICNESNIYKKIILTNEKNKRYSYTVKYNKIK